MDTINKVILVGYVVGKQPVLRTTKSGVKVTNFTLLTKDKWKDKKTGKIKIKNKYHMLVAWEIVAEKVCNLVKPGMHLYIEGDISYKNNDQQKFEIKIDKVSKFSNLKLKNNNMLEKE